MTCPICGRPDGGKMEDHHLLPKTFHRRNSSIHGKENLIHIHSVCHSKIHSTIPEADLYSHYHTVERLLEHEDIQKFIKWIKSKPVDFYSKNKDTSYRKKKRKH